MLDKCSNHLNPRFPGKTQDEENADCISVSICIKWRTGGKGRCSSEFLKEGKSKNKLIYRYGIIFSK